MRLSRKGWKMTLLGAPIPTKKYKNVTLITSRYFISLFYDLSINDFLRDRSIIFCRSFFVQFMHTSPTLHFSVFLSVNNFLVALMPALMSLFKTFSWKLTRGLLWRINMSWLAPHRQHGCVSCKMSTDYCTFLVCEIAASFIDGEHPCFILKKIIQHNTCSLQNFVFTTHFLKHLCQWHEDIRNKIF